MELILYKKQVLAMWDRIKVEMGTVDIKYRIVPYARSPSYCLAVLLNVSSEQTNLTDLPRDSFPTIHSIVITLTIIDSRLWWEVQPIVHT